MTKVVVISGSLRTDQSETTRILNPFLEGMRAAGASVDLVYAKRLKVTPCMGDFHCWYTNPGECRIKDGMQALYPKLKEADILVLATPVYIPLPGEMQNLINRLCPLVEPVLSWRDGRTRARLHGDYRIRSVVLVSCCGWWEKGNFGTVVRIAKELAKDINVKFAGAVLRPHASLLARNKKKSKEIDAALRKAGFGLVKDGKLPKALLDKIAQPLISEEEFRLRSNKEYESVGSRVSENVTR